ncbi:MAG: SDR family oxidoreductase, partial [Microthrixaceae bacterium]|nr:SDR family oxidoreductase [Microthrixaceae bacterium]
FDRFISVNLTGVMLGTKHGIRAMLPTGGGAILNWSSTGGLNGSRLPTAAYSASKAGVIAITKAAAIEYGAEGIRANTICPGFVETAMSGGKGAFERFPQLVGSIALKRPGQPEEVG